MAIPVRYGDHPPVAAGTPCVLCGIPQARPVTDHCHTHGWVRGILCPRCNSKMGYIDRCRVPMGRVLVPLADLVAYVSRCPECPTTTVEDIRNGATPVRPKPDYYDPEASVRKVRIRADMWNDYAEIVGDAGRSLDLKSYIEWRVDNPTTPLPGRRRGPVRRVRKPGRVESDE